MLISSKISNLECYAANDEYLVPISNWLENNASRHYTEWQGLIIEGPQENGCLLTLPHQGKRVFLKCFGVRNQKIYHIPILGLFSKALHAYKTSACLFRKGIPTPEPLAYVRFKTGPNKGKELFFTRWIDDSVTMGRYLENFFSLPKNSHWLDRKRKIIAQTAKLLRELHSAGIYHRDLNRENILVRENGDNLELFLIDTDDVRTAFRVSYKRVIKNIDKINRYILNKRDLSITDRMRFLKEYLGNERKGPAVIRKYWEEVEKITSKTLTKRNKEFIRKSIYIPCILGNADWSILCSQVAA